MSRIIILEGPRGVGKTTLASNLRQTVPELTLVNPTGFHLDGVEGLDKIENYYDNWFTFLSMTKKLDITMLFDRFFFTEMVFSMLYKSYKFDDAYNHFSKILPKLADRVDILFLTAKELDHFGARLDREKVEFNNIKDDKSELFKQFNVYTRFLYDDMFDRFDSKPNMSVQLLDTTDKSIEEVTSEAKQKLELI